MALPSADWLGVQKDDQLLDRRILERWVAARQLLRLLLLLGEDFNDLLRQGEAAASSLIKRVCSKWSRRDCSFGFGTTTGGDPACVSSSDIFERRLLRWINSATRVVCSLGSHAPSREPFAVALSELTWSPAGLC